MPDNKGERRECLIILEKVDWKDGLLKAVVTDAEVSAYKREGCVRVCPSGQISNPVRVCVQTGIIGDVRDIKRRRKLYYKICFEFC
jgi:hypothetical protein